MASLPRLHRSNLRNTAAFRALTPATTTVLGTRTFDQYSAGQAHAIERPALPAAAPPTSRLSRFFRSFIIAPVKISLAWFQRAAQEPVDFQPPYISTEEQNKRRRCLVPGAFPESPAPSPSSRVAASRRVIASHALRRRSPPQARPNTLGIELQSPPQQPTPDPMDLDTPPTNRFVVPDASMTDSTASFDPSPAPLARPVPQPVSRFNPRRISAPPPQQKVVATNRFRVPEESDDSDSDLSDAGDSAQPSRPHTVPHISTHPQGNVAPRPLVKKPIVDSRLAFVPPQPPVVAISRRLSTLAAPSALEKPPVTDAPSAPAMTTSSLSRQARDAASQPWPRSSVQAPLVDLDALRTRLSRASSISGSSRAGTSRAASRAASYQTAPSRSGSSLAGYSLSGSSLAGSSVAASAASSRPGSSVAARPGSSNTSSSHAARVDFLRAGSSLAARAESSVAAAPSTHDQVPAFVAENLRRPTYVAARPPRATRRRPVAAAAVKPEEPEVTATGSVAPSSAVEPATPPHAVTPVESEELSFLEDAPPPRPQKSVSFAGEKIYPDCTYVDWWDFTTAKKQGIYPTETRHYRTEAGIGEVVPQWHTRQPSPPETPDNSLVSTLSSTLPPTPESYERRLPVEGQAVRELRDQLQGSFKLTVSRRRQEKRAAAQSARERADEEERAAAAASQHEAELAAAEAREEEQRRREELGIIKTLDAQWRDKLARAMATADPAAEMAATGISRRDLGTVMPVSSADGIGWLNDEVVNGYLSAMTAAKLGQLGFDRSIPDAVPGQHSFSTHLYSTYKAKGWTGVSRWWSRARLGGQRLLRCKSILIPVNDRSHWTLLVINGAERTISYYDSMDNAGKTYTRAALDMVKANLGSAFVEADWQIVTTISQQQSNALDCGVYVCMNALAITQGLTPALAFRTAQMKDARRQVAATLLNGGFSGDFSLE